MNQSTFIVGGGLAGTLLAARLIEQNVRVVLVDAPDQPGAATRVAAGLFNVITGRFGAKSWRADALLPAFRKFFANPAYADLRSHIHDRPIYRPFREIAEFNKWTGRHTEPDYAPYVRFQPHSIRHPGLIDPWGGIFITPCGWVDAPAMVEALKNILRASPLFSRQRSFLDYAHIDPENRRLRLGDREHTYHQLAFCEGYFARSNPFFPDLPIRPNKGSILEVEIEHFSLPFVLSRKVYLIPRNNRFVLGATYLNRFDTIDPNPADADTLLNHLRKAVSRPVYVHHHRTGVRPTTPDRRPILGRHPRFPEMFVFNGLGTKGLLQGPFFSQQMAGWMCNPRRPPDVEVRLARFSKS